MLIPPLCLIPFSKTLKSGCERSVDMSRTLKFCNDSAFEIDPFIDLHYNEGRYNHTYRHQLSRIDEVLNEENADLIMSTENAIWHEGIKDILKLL